MKKVLVLITVVAVMAVGCGKAKKAATPAPEKKVEAVVTTSAVTVVATPAAVVVTTEAAVVTETTTEVAVTTTEVAVTTASAM